MSREFGTAISFVSTAEDRDFMLPVSYLASPAGAAPPTMRGMHVWTGSAWVEKPVKVWTGSAWVQKPVKFWNGSTWA